MSTPPLRAETFLRDLQGAVSSRRLYAADHPRNVEVMDRLEAHVAALTMSRPEFSALSDSQIAGELLSSHRDGIEVLRAALEKVNSPYAHLVEAVCLSLPPIDEQTRQRYLDLVNEGPPTETVGMTYLGNLKPFSAHGASSEEVRR